VKAAITSRHWKQAGLCAKARAIVTLLELIHSAYLESYNFVKDNIYYNSKANPNNHLKAYYQLMRICEKEKVKTKQCFPLQTSWVPGHMQIDTKILCEKFTSGKLQDQRINPKLFWRAVLNYNAKPFKVRANLTKFSAEVACKLGIFLLLVDICRQAELVVQWMAMWLTSGVLELLVYWVAGLWVDHPCLCIEIA
ncbi:hypothetical protein EV175_004937, partial [Coemansia sp. RSA 1933]